MVETISPHAAHQRRYSMSQSWDYIAKLVCIGDSGTGKSSVRNLGLRS